MRNAARWLGVILLELGLILLCGCGMTGIGSKNILRALYVEHEDGQYCVEMICFQSIPAADTSEAHETVQLIEGKGDTVFDALQQAQNKRGEETFYGQNELLLIGPNLIEQGPFEVTDFMVKQESGRPNTEVYLVDLGLSELRSANEKMGNLVDAIELLREQGTYHCALYQLSGVRSALLPLLRLDAKEAGAVQGGSVLYQEGRPQAHWDRQKTQLAQLMMGQAEQMRFECDQKQSISFQVDSTGLTYTVQPTRMGPVLYVKLRGHIRQIHTEEGAQPPQKDSAYVAQLNRWVDTLADQMIEETYGRGIDVFLFSSHLKNFSAQSVQRLAQQGALFHPKRVLFHSELSAL